MQYLDAVSKMNEWIGDVDTFRQGSYEDSDVFQLNEGVFARRKSWDAESHFKSVIPTLIFKNDAYRFKQDENGKQGDPVDFIVTGVDSGSFDAFEPDFEDTIADDWEICEVKSKKPVRREK